MKLDQLIRPNILQLKPYASARDEYQGAVDNMTFLDANENPFETGLNRYPDPYQNALKEILARQKGVSKEEILIGNGSDEVLDLIFRVFCEPNIDNVITLPPTYGMYEVLANTNAIAIKRVNLTSEFQIDVEGILEKVDAHTKLVFVCSPNNPTSNSIAIDRVETLLERFKGIVVIDEAYIDFSNQNSWIKRLSKYPNLIVTQTLSKAYGLAGIRLGTCYASIDIITTLNKIKPPYNVNALSQKEAISALSKNKVLREIKALIKQRSWLEEALKNVEFVEKIYPSDANFLLIKVDDANKRYKELIERGVVVRNRSNQPLCTNCLRITVGTAEENQELIKTMRQL